MAIGKIASPTPNLVPPEAVMAEKVANIAVPASSTTIWDQLEKTVPKTEAPPMSAGLSGGFATPVGTSKLMQMSSKLQTSSERYKSALPNLQGPPKKGIASSLQTRFDEEVAGGIGQGAQKGNTVFVDDANWPVTLKEIIGSRMLTTEQLEKASIQNVKKLFNVGLNTGRHQGSASVGTAQENEELYYMAQRMIIEGFIRGVDITKEIPKRGGLNVAIREVSFNKNAKNNIGLHSTGPTGSSINFNARHWRKMSEAEKYTLFMHEFGHGLLRRPELGASQKYDIMGDGPYGVAKRLMSNKDTYNMILNDHFGSANNKGTIAISKIAPGKGTPDFDPSWFPQLSGEAVKVDGGNYNPGDGTTGGTSGPDYAELMKGMFDSFKASSDAQFQSLTNMMQNQFQSQQEMMNQQMMQSAMNSMPGPSAQLSMGSSLGPAAPITAGGGGIMAGMGGGIDTTGFAQQLAHLDGGDEDQAGNLLASG